MSLKQGQVLQNRYRIVTPLGQGGMGAVYRAWDVRLNVPVALKEQIPQPDLDAAMLAQLRQQFGQEAMTLARLSHPNLVRVTDYFEEDGNAYLVMEFLEGENLAQRVERDGPVPETQVLVWARQLLDALVYCHAQGIVHRDIKPQNILLRPDGRAVLVDFGLVKLWNSKDPHTQTVLRGMGTPEYAPPEQYGRKGQTTDPRSDLYSLGASLYHALTGEAPPTASERMADPKLFQPVRALNPSVSPATETAITRALEPVRDARWSTATEMAQALSGGVDVSARHTTVISDARSDLPASRPSGHSGTALMPQPQSEAKKRIPSWVWMAGALALIVMIAVWATRPKQSSLVLTQMPTADPTAAGPSMTVTSTVPRPTSTSTPTSSPSPTLEPSPIPVAGGGFCDWFANTDLDDRWIWLDPLGGSQARINLGRLELKTSGADSNVYGDDWNKPRLYQKSTAESLIVQTNVMIQPNFAVNVMAFQGGGLFIYRNPQNHVWIGLGTSLPNIDGGVMTNGERANWPWRSGNPLIEQAEVYLRLKREGATISAGYSLDGEHWTWSDTVRFAAGEVQVGLVLFSDWESPGYSASFDYLLWDDCIATSISGLVPTLPTAAPTVPKITATPTTAPSPTPTRRTVSFEVFANRRWQNTGVELQPGDKILIEYVSGKWTGWEGTQPMHDANGPGDNYVCANVIPASQCIEPVPDYQTRALVGRVGSQILKVGNRLSTTVTSAGNLELRMNDGDDGLDDNAGSIIVRITYP